MRCHLERTLCKVYITSCIGDVKYFLHPARPGWILRPAPPSGAYRPTDLPMPTSPAKPHVFDATTDRFEDDVIQRSLQVPVLVDFWAEWCGPCKQLGPILEKLAGEYHGAFELAKVDVEKEQQLAAAFQVRSIPTVMRVMIGRATGRERVWQNV